jgi:hypothetical protein
MESNQQVANCLNPSLKTRAVGIAIVAALYATQLIALASIRIPLQQSVLLIIVAPIILGVGWLSSGLILGGTVFSRAFGRWRFVYGLLIAFFLSFLLVVGILEFLNNLPPTYNGL